MRFNRHHLSRNRLLSRLSGVCFNDPAPAGDGSGGDPGGGGGAGGGGATSPSSLPNGGGQVQQNADHSAFNTPPSSADHATRVRAVLDKGNVRDHTLTQDEIADLVRFDAPFASNTPAPTPAPQPNAVPTPTPTPATPAAPAAPALSPDAAAIIAALRQSGITQPQAPAAPNTPPATPKPYYGGDVQALQVSPQILSAIIGSDDPALLAQAAPAVNSLVNGIMNRQREDMMIQVGSIVQALLTSIPNQVQQVNTVRDTESKFYAGFQELQRPLYKPVVDNISSLYFQARKRQDPNFQWSPEAFREVGELVHRQLEKDLGHKIPRAAAPGITNAPPAPNNQQQTPAPAATQVPYVAKGGARPPNAPLPGSNSADLLAFV